MRECRLADQLDCARAMPRQLRQLQYKRFEGRAKLVLRCARHGRIGELALCRCAKLRIISAISAMLAPATGWGCSYRRADRQVNTVLWWANPQLWEPSSKCVPGMRNDLLGRMSGGRAPTFEDARPMLHLLRADQGQNSPCDGAAVWQESIESGRKGAGIRWARRATLPRPSVPASPARPPAASSPSRAAGAWAGSGAAPSR